MSELRARFENKLFKEAIKETSPFLRSMISRREAKEAAYNTAMSVYPIFEAITDAALIEHNNLYMKVIQIEAYEELQKKLEIALKTLKLIALNKTEDCEIYTMGCDCDEEARQALKQIEDLNDLIKKSKDFLGESDSEGRLN